MVLNLLKNSSLNARLQFNKELHEYSLDGKNIPSVSEIMKPLTVEYYKKIPTYILNKARDRGIKVHEAIELYILFGVIDEEVEEYIEQFKDFIEKHDFKVTHTELMLTDGIYAGTIDLIVETPENKRMLIDIKTTNKINESLISVQLNAYNLLLGFVGYNVDGCYSLLLKPNSYKFEPVELDGKTWDTLLNEHKNKADKH